MYLLQQEYIIIILITVTVKGLAVPINRVSLCDIDDSETVCVAIFNIIGIYYCITIMFSR